MISHDTLNCNNVSSVCEIILPVSLLRAWRKYLRTMAWSEEMAQDKTNVVNLGYPPITEDLMCV